MSHVKKLRCDTCNNEQPACHLVGLHFYGNNPGEFNVVADTPEDEDQHICHQCISKFQSEAGMNTVKK